MWHGRTKPKSPSGGLKPTRSAPGSRPLMPGAQGIQELAQRNAEGVSEGVPGGKRSDRAALFDLDEGAPRQAAVGGELVIAPAALGAKPGEGLPQCRRVGIRRREVCTTLSARRPGRGLATTYDS